LEARINVICPSVVIREGNKAMLLSEIAFRVVFLVAADRVYRQARK
jgi:hypothetical protein